MLEKSKYHNESSGFALNPIYLRGSTIAKVKKLSGFLKHHSLPSVKNQTTSAFIKKIGKHELEEFSQLIYQSLKSDFSYKRRELQFDQELGYVTIESPDFVIRITLDLCEEDMSQYQIFIELRGVKNNSLLESRAFQNTFDSLIDEIVVESSNDSACIEHIIDTIEDLEDEQIQVKYPPSADECTISIDAYDALLHFNHLGLRVQLRYGKSINTLVNCFLKCAELFPEGFAVRPNN